MKLFRGILVDDKAEEDGSEEDGFTVSETTELLVSLDDVGELLGQWEFPKTEKTLKKKIELRVIQPEPMYGTGKNRSNGFYPSWDEALFETLRAILLKRVEDNSKKPSVRTKLIEEPPSFFEKRSKFKVELRVAKVNADGERVGWSEPYYTKAHYRKSTTIPELDDLLDTKVPSVALNE